MQVKALWSFYPFYAQGQFHRTRKGALGPPVSPEARSQNSRKSHFHETSITSASVPCALLGSGAFFLRMQSEAIMLL